MIIKKLIRLALVSLFSVISLVVVVEVVGVLLVPDIGVFIKSVTVKTGVNGDSTCISRAATRVPELSSPQSGAFLMDTYFKSSVVVLGRPINFLARRSQPGYITLMALGPSPIGIIPWYPGSRTEPVLQSFFQALSGECTSH